MQKRKLLSGLLGLTVVLMVLGGYTAAVRAQTSDQIDYWRTKYRKLTFKEDPRVERAHTIFQRLVQVAGKRPGTVPQLFIGASAASEPWGIVLPIALPDGWIVLSSEVLDICYQDSAWGDDRLAFVLAHEIAHQLNDDFWHMRLPPALEKSTMAPPVALAFIEEIASTAEHVLARELKADMSGILYAAMAGFNTRVIVTEDRHRNFFVDWVRALDRRRLGGVAEEHLRPTPAERAEVLRENLRRIVDATAAFEAGLWFYYAGDYQRAIGAFEYFRAVFPSREVLHNLAVSHNQFALQAYQMWKKDVPLPFQLFRAIDPLTRASQRVLEGPRRGDTGVLSTPAAQFRQHLDKAIALYREALTLDTAYTPAAVNLGGALIVRGVHTETQGLKADFYDAVTTLQRALEHAPNASATPALLNTLGVALFYIGQLEQAKAQLVQARTLAPAYAAPVFNLGYMAHAAQPHTNAQLSWPAYQQRVTQPSLAFPANGQHQEQVMGRGIGAVENRIPPEWGSPAKSTFLVEKKAFTMATYPARIMTLSQDGEILMLIVREGYQGASARGIKIGAADKGVLAHYGPPSRQSDTTYGNNWTYDVDRIAFQLRDGKVVSWLLF